MSHLNKTFHIGNLTREVEVKFTTSGKAIANIGLAVNESWKNDAGEKQESTVFVDIEAWGKLAEISGQYLKKGSQIMCEGKLRLDSWDDKATGQKRSKLKIVAENIQFLGGTKGDGGQSTQRAPGGAPSAPPDPDADNLPDVAPF